MTKFNPENKTTLTYGECLDPAMKITDSEDAKQYFDEYVKYIMTHMKETELELHKKKSENNGNIDINAVMKYEAEKIAKHNLGYYAGYGSNELRAKVEKLFNCSHPIFGNIVDNGSPTGEEAFECGKQNKTLTEIRK